MGNTKTIIKLIESGQYEEAKEQAQELREALLELREKNSDLREENASLKAENAQLSGEVRDKKEVEWSDPYYYLKDDTKHSSPLCPRCYGKDERRSHMQAVSGLSIKRYCCPACGWTDNPRKPTSSR